MNQDFNDLPWHDAELKEIVIERTQQDIVKLYISWPEDFGSEQVCIEFENCYAFHANMNFGIVPPDFILFAECITECPELDNLRKLWSQMGVDLSNLCCYRITTNSTNSIINIYALSFKIVVPF